MLSFTPVLISVWFSLKSLTICASPGKGCAVCESIPSPTTRRLSISIPNAPSNKCSLIYSFSICSITFLHTLRCNPPVFFRSPFLLPSVCLDLKASLPFHIKVLGNVLLRNLSFSGHFPQVPE